MGEQLEPIRLFEHTKPGETITIAVKASADTAREDAFRRYTSISYASLKRPDPEMLYAEATSAQYLVPTLGTQRDYAQGVLDGALRISMYPRFRRAINRRSTNPCVTLSSR